MNNYYEKEKKTKSILGAREYISFYIMSLEYVKKKKFMKNDIFKLIISRNKSLIISRTLS